MYHDYSLPTRRENISYSPQNTKQITIAGKKADLKGRVKLDREKVIVLRWWSDDVRSSTSQTDVYKHVLPSGG